MIFFFGIFRFVIAIQSQRSSQRLGIGNDIAFFTCDGKRGKTEFIFFGSKRRMAGNKARMISFYFLAGHFFDQGKKFLILMIYDKLMRILPIQSKGFNLM